MACFSGLGNAGITMSCCQLNMTPGRIPAHIENGNDHNNIFLEIILDGKGKSLRQNAIKPAINGVNTCVKG